VSSGALNELELAGPTIVAMHPSTDTGDRGLSSMVRIPHSLIVTLDPDVLDVILALTVSVRSLKVTTSARAGRATANAAAKRIVTAITLAHLEPCIACLSFMKLLLLGYFLEVAGDAAQAQGASLLPLSALSNNQ
jgi:hypothetical protein